jgi:hypothetical protein
MFQIMPESQGKILRLRATGKLTDLDYQEVLTPRLEALNWRLRYISWPALAEV